jgi:hypothetical protein
MGRAAALLVLASGISLAAQPPARDNPHPKPPAAATGTVAGRVVAADSELPLRNARVTLSSEEGPLPSVGDPRSAITKSEAVVFATIREKWDAMSRFVNRATPDPNGALRFEGLPPGEYYVADLDRVR